MIQGLRKRRQDGQEITRRSNPGRKVADRAGRDEEGTSLKLVGDTESLRPSTSEMKRNKERRQRFGGRALRAPRARNRCRFAPYGRDDAGPNGPDAFAQITKLRPEIPEVFTTGYAAEVNLIVARSQKQPRQSSRRLMKYCS